MELAQRIEELWERDELDAEAIEEALRLLDRGEARVAERRNGEWVVNEWAKKAILLYFRLRKVEPMEVGGLRFLDKIPVKADYAERGVRVVPPGVARYGSFLSEGVVLMPGFVNIGAWVGPRTMVDTWATVGSCAQIGADVHLAGGVGIGGVLEPPKARPVIVEDGAFVGSRAIVDGGRHRGRGAVLAPHVALTATVPIIDVTGPSRSSIAGTSRRARSCCPARGRRSTRRERSRSAARSSSESGAPRPTSGRRSTTSCGSSRSEHETAGRDRALHRRRRRRASFYGSARRLAGGGVAGGGDYEAGEVEVLVHERAGGADDGPANEDHFAVGVPDVDTACDELRAAGLELLVEPRDYPWGRSAYLRDRTAGCGAQPA